jgi:hypothetical protein
MVSIVSSIRTAPPGIVEVCCIHSLPVFQAFSWERHAPAWLPGRARARRSQGKSTGADIQNRPLALCTCALLQQLLDTASRAMAVHDSMPPERAPSAMLGRTVLLRLQLSFIDSHHGHTTTARSEIDVTCSVQPSIEHLWEREGVIPGQLQ